MSKSFKKDLTGQRFGRLTVLEFVSTEDRHTYWLCKCDCGKFVTVQGSHLNTSRAKSCGCFRSDFRLIHGNSNIRLYRIWRSMKNRCNNPKNYAYKNYGGRGITVCDEWENDFTKFRDWAMSHGYADNLSIDRIDVNGNYEPENCRWTEMKTQQRNKSNNTFVEYQGEKITLAEAAEKTGINMTTLWRRYHHGDRGKILFRPVKKQEK